MVIKVCTKDRRMKMQKLLSLLLAALLALAPAYAMATGVTYKTYQNETNGYSIDYPADWTVLSKETIRSNPDSLTQAGASVVETYKEQIDSKDMAVIMSGDGAVTVAIGYNPVSVQLTSNDLISTVYPAVLQQLEDAFEHCAPLNEPEAAKVGRLEFVRTAYKIRIQAADCVMLQAFYGSVGTFYTINCTVNSDLNPDMDAVEAIFSDMLASFVPI
jgi:hypothetical protein